MTKICQWCKQEKDEDEFYWKNKSKGKRQGHCKECQSGYTKRWYSNNKDTHKADVNARRKRLYDSHSQFIWDYLSSVGCAVCGETDPVVLEFDHLYDKQYNIAHMRGDCGLAKLKAEIAKCQVLCANCHKRKTAVQFNFYSNVNKTVGSVS